MSFTRSKKVMESLDDIIKEHNLLPEGSNIANLSMNEAEQIFLRAFTFLIGLLYGEVKKSKNVKEVTVGRL